MARILVVDDHPDTARTYAMLLRHLGHEARPAAGGRLCAWRPSSCLTPR
jgi:CheY-like chemotaxis protein